MGRPLHTMVIYKMFFIYGVSPLKNVFLCIVTVFLFVMGRSDLRIFCFFVIKKQKRISHSPFKIEKDHMFHKATCFVATKQYLQQVNIPDPLLCLAPPMLPLSPPVIIVLLASLLTTTHSAPAAQHNDLESTSTSPAQEFTTESPSPQHPQHQRPELYPNNPTYLDGEGGDSHAAFDGSDGNHSPPPNDTMGCFPNDCGKYPTPPPSKLDVSDAQQSNLTDFIPVNNQNQQNSTMIAMLCIGGTIIVLIIALVSLLQGRAKRRKVIRRAVRGKFPASEADTPTPSAPAFKEDPYPSRSRADLVPYSEMNASRYPDVTIFNPSEEVHLLYGITVPGPSAPPAKELDNAKESCGAKELDDSIEINNTKSVKELRMEQRQSILLNAAPSAPDHELPAYTPSAPPVYGLFEMHELGLSPPKS